ncbi:MAG: PQQ-binding-like beta-propeller repeat protein [Verrucomicrobiales bacterium]|nr:PQQ-binding-like beta-propeller repeat protein [Verrucomicrobiales bacterium]
MGRLDGADWPRFLGIEGDGRSSETGLVDRIPTNGLPVVWERAVGTGYGAPSVRAGQVVLHHREGNQEILESMEVATGKTTWRLATPSQFQDPYGYNNGPRCTPLLTSDKVFAFGAEGRLLCVDRVTGKKLWERETGKEFEVPEAFFGVGSTPLLEGGRVLVMVGGQPNSGVVAFDPETGKTLWESVGETNWVGQTMRGWPGEPLVRWQRAEKQASYASPVPATFHGQRQVLCLMRQGLVSLNPTNGAVNFSFWFRARVNDSVNAASPVVRDDLILISAAYYRVGSVLLKVRPDGRGVDEVWRGTSLEMHWSTPLLVDGHLYGFSGRNEPDAVFRCVEFGTGKVKWERDERWPPHSTRQPGVFGRGAMILADGKLIAVGEGGLLGMFRPTTERCEELGRWQVPSLGHPCWAAPVLSDGRLFLRSEDRLVCLSVKAP